MLKLKYGCLAILLVLVFLQTAFAQQGRNLDDHVLIQMSQNSIFQPVGEKFEGSPYLDDSFVDGDVYCNGGKYVAVPMRYNVYKDNVEFKKSGQIYILDASLKIDKLTLGENILVVQKYPFKGAQKLGYLTLLDSGKAMLMRKHMVGYREAQPPKPLETEGKLARFSKLPDIFFIKVGNGELKEVGSLKKTIEDFPDKQSALNEFAKKEKISTRKEEDLIKLVQYYNALE